MADDDTTNVWIEGVLPVTMVVGSVALAMVTAGGSIGASIGASAMVSGGLISGVGIVTEGGIIAAGGSLITTKLLSELILSKPD